MLLARILRNVPHPGECLPEIAAATDGLTGAHLQEAVQLAVQVALDEQCSEDTALPTVTEHHLREAVRLVKKQMAGQPGFYA
jgi:hypothetical protein